MFYIIESEHQKTSILKRIEGMACFVDVIPSNDLYHPKLTTTTAIYIRPVTDSTGYILPIGHSECISLDKDCIYELLKKPSTLYTLNKKDLLYHFNLQEALNFVKVQAADPTTAKAGEIIIGTDNSKLFVATADDTFLEVVLS